MKWKKKENSKARGDNYKAHRMVKVSKFEFQVVVRVLKIIVSYMKGSSSISFGVYHYFIMLVFYDL